MDFVIMNDMNKCNRCGASIDDSRLWLGKYWCADCFQQQTGLAAVSDGLPRCALCGEDLMLSKQHSFFGEPVCIRCLLQVGPERAQLLVRVRALDPVEVSRAILLLRKLLNRNQTMRLREAIGSGGRNWWVKLPEFGEYVCRFLSEQGIEWDGEILDEIWDRLVEEAVEE